MRKSFWIKSSFALISVLGFLSQPAAAEGNMHFSNCKEAWANGYSDMRRGEPGYSSKLDRDGDGIACERANAPKGAFKPRQSAPQSSGWVMRGGDWYYLNAYGSAVTSTWQGNYYLKSDGRMAMNEWIYDGNYKGWYYLKSDGSYAKNAWQGSYYLKSNGKLARSEWVYDGSYQAWYYLKSDGSYAKNAWQGNYYLKPSGKLARSEWIYDSSYKGWYYLKSDGSYAYNTWQGSYYLKSNGKMATSEWLYDSYYQAWYYLKADGAYAYNAWQGNYYLKSNGKMAQSEWVDGGRYYVDASGIWKATAKNSKVTNKGSYYSLQGKYDEIIVINKRYPMSKYYNPGENPVAKAAFLKLIAQMQAEGYPISSSYSGFRSYATQAQLYQNYVNQNGKAAADRYSARPGHSEHQTGLTFDVIGSDGQLVTEPKAAKWLRNHAADYGFVVRYPHGKESVTGYMAEEWHLRYIGKEAKEIAASGLTLEEYYGFEGGDYLE